MQAILPGPTLTNPAVLPRLCEDDLNKRSGFRVISNSSGSEKAAFAQWEGQFFSLSFLLQPSELTLGAQGECKFVKGHARI